VRYMCLYGCGAKQPLLLVWFACNMLPYFIFLYRILHTHTFFVCGCNIIYKDVEDVFVSIQLIFLFLSFCRKSLSDNKHVKYLYIPYTDTVVVVTCNPVSKWKGPPKFKPKYSQDEAIQHARDLYRESLQKYRYRWCLLLLNEL
jgi:hypothetical protein